MKKNEMSEMIKFMQSFFADEEVWVSEDMKIPVETQGFIFTKKKEIKGLIVFGGKYPISNKDLQIKDHLKVWDAIKNTKPTGMVFSNSHSWGEKMYQCTDGEIKFI